MAIASFLPAPPVIPNTPPASDFSRFSDEVRELLGCDEVVLLTTMPRGGLQVCRRLAIEESLIRRYHATLHPQDTLAWRALVKGLATPSPSSDADESPLATGYTTVLALRVESPIFGGYPGVVLAMRKRSSTASVQSEPEAQADHIRALFNRTVAPKRVTERVHPPRHFVFDANGACIVGEPELQHLDPAALSGMAELVAAALRGEIEAAPARRTHLTDSRGAVIPVELNRFDTYPALSHDRIVFVTLHPDISDWSAITDRSFEADPELSRLVQSVGYMLREFRTGPTLDQIARAVQLSPFHFHRKFSEVIGITPKHLLYDLQIDCAKKLLADPQRPLLAIARECGFSHQSHFTSRFKQGSGVTPSRWRRAVLQMSRA